MSPLPPKAPRIADFRFSAWVLSRWYGPKPIVWLKPLASVFAWFVKRRRLGYLTGRYSIQRLPVPVLVVGNIVVGGGGKTPTVLAVVQALKELGWSPGVISRGYGSHQQHARLVHLHSTADQVGDEPVLLFRQSKVPVAVGVQRSEAGQLLLDTFPHMNCLVSDDGLQHYALHRDLELIVMERSKGLGNQALLPAGPLREPPSRLEEVDALVLHGTPSDSSSALTDSETSLPQAVEQLELKLTMLAPIPFQVWFDCVHQSDNPSNPDLTPSLPDQQDWSKWIGTKVHAVAGIAHPQHFFSGLIEKGLQVVSHPFPDHHRFMAEDLSFPEPYPIVMTEKDAVKCQLLNLDRHWVVPLRAELDPRAKEWLRYQMESMHGPQTT